MKHPIDEKKDMLRRLTVLDFVAVDLQLFLNTHPDEAEALTAYNQTVTESAALRQEYERLYGPLVSYRSPELSNNWRWSDNPWPWQTEFNFGWSMPATPLAAVEEEML